METLKKINILFTLVLAFSISACQKDGPLDSGDENLAADDIELVLASEFDTNDENPAFGKASLQTDDDTEVRVDDNLTTDTDRNRIMDTDSTTKVYFVRMTFGRLEGDTTATDVVDWSGSLQVNKGAIVVRKTIKFERGDRLDLPRESRQELNFKAFTVTRYDGIAFAIVDDPALDLDGILTVNAGQFSTTFSFSELDSLGFLQEVGADEISIISHSKFAAPFAGGFFTGHWYRVTGNSGGFEGRWISPDSDKVGHLKGRWGKGRRGSREMHGKIINDDGTFIGKLNGEWGYNRTQGRRGWLAGKYVNRSNQTVGTFKGHFHTGTPEDRKGFMAGRWKERRSLSN